MNDEEKIKLMKMIDSILPIGRYGYSEAVVSKMDLDKLKADIINEL